MFRIIGIIAFGLAWLISGYAGLAASSFLGDYWSSPWPQIFGAVFAIVAYMFINSVLYNRILFRKQFEKFTPVFEVNEEYGVITYTEDFWWLFYLPKKEDPISVPQGVRDQDGHYDAFQKIHKILESKFTGFDFEQIRQAIGSTTEAKFLVWSSNA